MRINYKFAAVAAIIFLFFANPICLCAEESSYLSGKYPDFAGLYIGYDKYENFNRKMFIFNLRLNRYVFRPVHILWASIMPIYGMDRITCFTKNIEYPIRLMSTLVQKDFPAARSETVRFLTNTTIGVCGMFDAAKSIFKIKPVQENMEQALAKCHMKRGCYLIMPVISSTTPRDILGRILDAAFNPSSYIASPAIAAVKAAIMVNRTYYMQPIVQMVESTYADPYDIAKKVYGLENYIKYSNMDRMNLLADWLKTVNYEPEENQEPANNEKHIRIKDKKMIPDAVFVPEEELNPAVVLQGSATMTDIIMKQRNNKHALDNLQLMPDIVLSHYNPQAPVIDSMRTALFSVSGMNSDVWADFSIWNRGFYKRLKTASINIVPERANYKYRYLLQKDKNAPVAVIYPSIGEGVMSSHPAMFAKIFYDEGYSVVIIGSHFQWEFVSSMPKNYRPGIPSVDAEYVKMTTDKILSSLKEKHGCKFPDKVVMGTSFGAMMTLFIAQKEYNPNEENHARYIAICPPYDLFYAMTQVDKNTEQWRNSPENLKDRVALLAAKIIQVSEYKDSVDKNNLTLPFSDDEAKMITGFILHQKLSDLIFTIEDTPKIAGSGIYTKINNMDYNDYVNTYLVSDSEKQTEVMKSANLGAISEYLKNSDNYIIYHSMDDYLTNTNQLKRLKMYTGTKTVLFNNGAHLGFLYRPEFLKAFKQEILREKLLLSRN